jgi:hypothetical protein
MAQPQFYTYSGAFLPGTLARAEAEGTEFTSVQVGFARLAIQGVDSGAANAYVVTTSGGQDGTYTDGMIVEFKAANASTSSCTIAVDSGATVGLTNPAGQALASGAIAAGTWYRAMYNSTYSAFTVVAPTAQTVTIGTISSAAPTHLVGLVAAGGVATAAAPIDVTFAIDQSIAPTWTGAHTFANTVAFNSTVTFAGGLALTGASGQYAATLTGNSATGHSLGLEVNAGTNASDIALLVNNQSGATQFFQINGQGSVTVGTPTGGAQGVGTINATGLFVNGAAVKTTSVSSANPSASVGLAAVNGTAATFMTSDSAPPLSQAITPTWTGAHTFTPGSGVAITVNAPVNTIGLALVGGANTANHYLMTLITGQGSGFSSGLLIEAGTTSADNAILVNNAANNATLFQVEGNGAGQVGQNGSGQPNIQWFVTGTVEVQGEFEVNNAANNTLLFEVTGNTTSPTVEGYGPVAAGMVDMTPDKGTFTITYTGMSTTVTATAKWSRNGNQVLLILPAASGTSNALTFTATGLPASIQPATTHQAICNALNAGCFEDNTTGTTASITMTASSGTITFGKGGVGGNWTNSGTKGVLNALAIGYILN